MDIKSSLLKLKNGLPKSKGAFLAIIGLVGLLLLLVSSFDFDGDGQTDTSQTETASNTVGYAEQTELRLEEIISDMLGNTAVKVMVTLESGSEYIYADEIKTDADVTKDQGQMKTQQSDSNQKSYVIVKDSNGNERPLVVTEKMPTVRGVVVVCEGGETPSVSAAVKLAVRSALGIDQEKICVIGRHSGKG